ncbi:HAD-like domain-containing protein [Mycena floridula]|nr:HAD-like domain-containing protein [Mycena floridula]
MFFHVRQHCRRSLHNLSQRQPPAAFVFDIDGVLLRGEHVLPEAKRALAMLDGNNPFRIKIPFLLMTNGGGTTEKERCEKLTRQLGFQIDPRQYIQSHTILKQFAHKYDNDHVLVLGGRRNKVREVAESYGFKNVYTPLDVLRWNPSVWPFHELHPKEIENTKVVDFSKFLLSAVFVFHDPRDWALDIQILCDVLQSGGVIGGPYKKNPGIELVFCNPDLLWRSDFDRPRLGQGAFKESFQAVYKAVTGAEYPLVQFGKPTEPAYKFAEKVLLDYLKTEHGPNTRMPPIYMIGDNPASDIAGAIGANWKSVLVHTGVYEPGGKKQLDASNTPTHESQNVEEAVRWALEQELARF